MIGPAVRTSRGRVRRVIVVGAGISGLSAVVELARQGIPVLHLCSSSARQSPSACGQEGIEFESLDSGLLEALPGALSSDAGCPAPGSALSRYWVSEAPRVLTELAALGVPFNRENSGALAAVRGLGASGGRTAFSAATTGLQVVTALDRQVRAAERQPLMGVDQMPLAGESLVEQRVGWDVLGLVQDDRQVVVGVVAFETRTGRLSMFAADAVCLATGAAAGLFGVTGSFSASAAALGAAIEAGAVTVSLGDTQFEPLCLDGTVVRPLGTLLLALGARIWSARTKKADVNPSEVAEAERDFFAGSELLDGAALLAGIRRRVAEGRPVYLDLRHVPTELLMQQADFAIELIRTFAGCEPAHSPVKVVMAPSGAAGGLWVDHATDVHGDLVTDSPRNQATSLPGLYAAGDLEWRCRAPSTRPGQRIVARLLAGRLAAKGMAAYRSALAETTSELPQSVFDRALRRFDKILDGFGTESAAESVVCSFDVEAQLSELMRRVAAGEGELAQWRKSLDSLGRKVTGAVWFDPVVQHSAQRRFLLHWDGLLAFSRAFLDSVEHQRHSSESSSTVSCGPLARWEAGAMKVLSEFQYQSVGRNVSVGPDAMGRLESERDPSNSDTN